MKISYLSKVIKNTFFFCLAMGVLLVSSKAFAVATGPRNVTSVGCHTHDFICYVSFDGAPAGQPGCTTNEMRWGINSYNGRVAYASFLAAMHSGRQVNFEIGAGCFSSQPAWPTFSWYRVYD